MAITERTYPLEVEGIGNFTIKKRRVPDQVRIQSDASRMTGGPVDDPFMREIALAYSTLKYVVDVAPDGWNIDDIDPLNSEDVDKLLKVWEALREAEVNFRKGASS